tara:strand:- start:1274 stop:1669 length:396 start_codon:yes stop_codon:yes gene_type:complete
MANNGKGIGPNRLGASKQGNMGAGSVHAWDVSDNSSKKNQRDNFASKDGLNSPAKNMNKGYGPMETSAVKQTAKQKKNLPKQIVDAIAAKSPAKKNGMKYDIKQASNQNLSASARKNYAENAQHDSKKGYR